jgi:arylsulfatase A-like enzyme
MKSPWLLASLIAMAAACATCGGGAPVPIGVVLVTLDTTRADRLSAYGFMSAVQPSITRLARDAVVFDQAMTVAPLTLPAHASLFTGLRPTRHGVRDNADPALADRFDTLAEILQRRRFRTAAFVASAVVARDRGLAQGFDRYDDGGLEGRKEARPRQRRAAEIVDAAVAWLDQLDAAPFFLWAHLYDPHRPYDPPAPYSAAADPYVGEIAYADAQLGRLIDELRERQLFDQTVVVVAADHGESLGEHDERDHGVFLYESVMRVPLILRAPGIVPGRVQQIVSLVDVLPTVLALLSIEPAASDGRSLMSAIAHGARDQDAEAYAESMYPLRLGWSGLRALRAGRYKYIEAPRPELYDLERDPFETDNLASKRPETAAAHSRRLKEIAAAEAIPAAGAADIAPEQRARLAALGYVTGPRPAASATDAALPDPKDCIRASPLSGPPDATVPFRPCR